MQTTPSYHMEGFTTAFLGCHFFKEIFDHMKDLDCELFYSELNVNVYNIYLLSSHR